MPSRVNEQPSVGITLPDGRPCCETANERLDIIHQFHESESIFDVFTAPIRVGIVFLLLRLGTACVCEIQQALSASSQPLVSHHLRALKEAGWLIGERRGRWVYYTLVDEKRLALQSILGKDGE